MRRMKIYDSQSDSVEFHGEYSHYKRRVAKFTCPSEYRGHGMLYLLALAFGVRIIIYLTLLFPKNVRPMLYIPQGYL